MKSVKSKLLNLTKVDKRSNLSQKELFKEYIEPEIPVVLTDAAKDWEAIGKFTPAFFKQNYPNLSKTLDGVTYKMDDFIDRMLASTPENVAPYPYNFNVEEYFPELLQYMKPEILFAKSDRVNHKLTPKFLFGNTHRYELFFGGKGAKWYTLHVDALCLHTQITQVYGAKTFFLYSPDQTPYLYPDPEQVKQSLVNVFTPDYKKFPLFSQAKCVQVTVEQGETLLFPKGWWHTTEMNGPCITLGRVQLNAANWKDFCDDNYDSWKKKNNMLRVPAYMYARLLGHAMNMQESLTSK